MVVPSHLVAYPPPENQGSVLGRIVTCDSRLGQLLHWVAIVQAHGRLLASVQAELAALRAAQPVCDYLSLHRLSEFKPYRSYSKSTRKQLQNDEPLFASRSCFEILRGDVVVFEGELRIAVKSVNRISTCADFLVTLDGGDVVSSNLLYRMGSIKKAEKIQPTHPIEKQICKILVALFEKDPSKKSLKEGLRTETFECLYGEKAAPAPWMQEPDAIASLANEISHRDLWLVKTKACELQSKKPHVFKNFCGHRKAYVKWEHTCPMLQHGKACVEETQSRDDVAEWYAEDKREWEAALAKHRSLRAMSQREQVGSHENELDCAERRYITVYCMFRKGTISRSAFEATKEHYARLLRAEQRDDHPAVKETLTFVRQQDVNLATESCLTKETTWRQPCLEHHQQEYEL